MSVRPDPFRCWSLLTGISLGLGIWTLEFPTAVAAPVPAPDVNARPLSVPTNGQAGFTLLEAHATGVLFTNTFPQERHLTNQIFLNGSGVACGDVDGDGWPDLYLCALEAGNRLFRNLGEWRFEDVTQQSGVALPNVASTAAA